MRMILIQTIWMLIGLQLLYNKTGNFYVKLDLARALKKYKLDDDCSSKAYVSFGKYF